MAALDLAYFEAHPDAFEALSDEDRMTLSQGDTIEGEISGESLDAEQQAQDESQDESQEEVEAEESAPAVLAKDGKHTIPFEELQSAREQARYWQAQAEQAQAEAKAAAKAAQSETAENTVDLKSLRKQIREAWINGEDELADSLQAEADAEILRQAQASAINVVTQREAEAQRQAIARAVQAEESAALKAYPFLDHKRPETANWEAIAQVQGLVGLYVDNGQSPDAALRAAVAKIVPQYVGQQAQQTTDDSVSSRAAAAIAKAKTKTPISMSSIPASANPPLDEAAAIAEMNVESLHDKFMSLPRERILELMARQM